DRRRPDGEAAEPQAGVDVSETATETATSAAPAADPDAAPDWDSAVLDPVPVRRGTQPDDAAWTDWSPGSSADASDVWLPDLVFEEDEAPPPPPAPPAPAADDDPWADELGEPAEAAEAGDVGEARMTAPDLTHNLDARTEEPDSGELFTVVPFKPRPGGEASTDEAPVVEAAAPAAEPEAEAGAEAGAEAELAESEDGDDGDDEARRFRSAPSWPPPPRRKSIGIIALCSLVVVVMLALLITNGRLGRPKTASTNDAQNRPVLATDPALVPREWIAYRHPNVDFTVSYPPRWTLREEGSVITVRDPTTGTELRVDFKKARGPDPEQAWLTQERDVLTKHPNDYKRLQLSAASYLGKVAALWEYTYLDANLPVHAVDLGFLTDDYAFTMSFRAPAGTWDTMLPMFHGFLSSVRAPE
ncbi:MAG: hypothetical protein ACRD2W_18185, partial [Acidimicrobiales bacterium]